ncbi:hypothetical protein TraAM80_02325 [Trypanosoma rangeli]|uniref:Uncharacterized protein n=1 Tax=Trypanosoma rangeli TaxID=5698 RepID=A0A3R7L7J7_TRYRA|nr:uncharacterized protein TraAM80_02325 [Trypanosoma rangeli]RNF09180.1 hypothetical protein TraAM80_02325 [Trypanosoma rangeli]|eukprot:RNF09180.1 hypothetical protein TraAM80_02325 [Trypanosoma rangeli]
MFGRRVFASASLPRHMWASLHIQNKRQAQRVLPSLTPLASLMASCQLSSVASVLSVSQSVGVMEPLHGDEDPLMSAATIACHRGYLAALTASWCMPLRTIVWILDSKVQHVFPRVISTVSVGVETERGEERRRVQRP